MLGGVALGMLAMAYAAVPLYDLFCRVTGYGGTVQEASGPSEHMIDHKVMVRFDANVASGMPWKFKPVERSVELRLGENALVSYRAHNPTDKPVSGTATFNVTPEAAGRYFNKIECFCFIEQTLEPGASVDMPVSFFVDPELINDFDTKRIKEITLSYTFFRTGDDDSVAKAGTDEQGNSGS